MFSAITFRGDCPTPKSGCSSKPHGGSQQGALPPDQPEWFCHCLKVQGQAVSDEIVLRGAKDIQAVQKGTGAGTGCTACVRRIQEMLGRLVHPDQLQPSEPSAGSGPDGDAKIK